MAFMQSLLVPMVVGLVRLYTSVYTVVTLPLYYLLQQPWRRLKASRECGANIVGRGRMATGSDEIPKPIQGLNYLDLERYAEIPFHPMMVVQTMDEAFDEVIKLYPLDRPALGYRDILSEEVQYDHLGNPVRIDGKLLRKYRLSEYRWLTLGEVHERATALFRGLVGEVGVKANDRVAVFAETSVHFFINYVAQAYCGTVIVSVFHAMNDESIIFALNQTKASCLYTTFELLDRVANIADRCPHLKTIVYLQGPKESVPTELPARLRMFTFAEVMKIGRKPELRNVQKARYSPDQLCSIVYTSGTTGCPKGVTVTSRQLREAALAIGQVVRTVTTKGPEHIYIAYLPQAHVLELSIEMFLFMGGVRIGFATPFTLNESAPGLVAGCPCDLQLLRPTVMTAVPLVLDRMQKEIDIKLQARTPFSKDLFYTLIDYKRYWMGRGYRTPVVDQLVCPKVREQFGGRLQYMVVGSAPLAEQLQSLIKCALNVTLIQGYGTTETTGGVVCMDFDDLTFGRVGAPLNGVRVRMVDWPEGGYSVNDKPNPRGELIVGGPMISQGYFDLEAESMATFFDARDPETSVMRHYYVSGDIGELFPDNTLRIIDRKKDLVKLANGEYISLGKIESILKSSRFVDNICIVDNSLLNCLVGLVMPNQRSLLELAHARLNLPTTTLLDDICNNAEVIDTVHQDVVRVGFAQGLKAIELPSLVALCSDEWSPDNDLLTAAMKLKRVNVHRRYRDQLAQLFARLAAEPRLHRVKRVQ